MRSPVKMANRRQLYDWETRVARTVFSEAIDYRRVRVHEGVGWANMLDDWARRLRAMQPRPVKQHNAIALGSHCFFPVRLPHQSETPSETPFASMAWLLHELTHVWQFQRMGWRYLPLVLAAHVREGERVYDFGGEAGLHFGRRKGWRLQCFNLEQQATIVQSAYCHARAGLPDAIWREYLADGR